MVYMYGWMMEENQTIGIDYQTIRDDYIEDSITQYYMKFNEDRQDESRFWDHTFSQAEFDNPIRSIRQSLTRRGERNSSRRKI